MKEFFKKIWAWILKNKIISIAVGSVLAVGVVCAIALPIALKHNHDFSAELKSNETHHYYECECGEKKDEAEHVFTNACDAICDECGFERTVGVHVYDNACDTTCNECGATRTIQHDHSETLTAGETTHWFECSVCGDKKDETAHVFNQNVSSPEYLKESTATKYVYYKSCVCGAKGSETFDVNKTVAVLENVAITPVEIIYGNDYSVNYSTNSNGAVTIQWFKGSKELNHKPTEVGNNYKVKVSISGTGIYTPVESALIPFEIKPVVLQGLSTDVTYNGTLYHFIDLDEIEYGLRLDVTFNSENVGATPTAVTVTLDGEPTNNYIVDTTSCIVNIVQKEIDLEWTAPANLYFDETAKVPTVVATDLCDGDECNVTIALYEGDDVWYGSTFKYAATGLSNDNYKLPQNVISQEYAILIHETVEVGEEADVGATWWYDNVSPYTMYYSIDLEAGYYYFNYTSSEQGVEFTFELYKKGNISTEIAIYEVNDSSTTSNAFKIEEEGNYYVKVVTEDESQYETLTILKDEHDAMELHGFCDKGCGTYLGKKLDTNCWETVTIKSGDKVYYRFEDAGDVSYKVSYHNSDNGGLNYKCYRTDNNGNFVEVSLSETATEFVGSFDGYYYVVISFLKVGGGEKTFTFQIEELV